MLSQDKLQSLEEELLFTDETVADALNRRGWDEDPAAVERQLSLLVCAGCGNWVYWETVVDELCIDCRDDGD